MEFTRYVLKLYTKQELGLFYSESIRNKALIKSERIIKMIGEKRWDSPTKPVIING